MTSPLTDNALQVLRARYLARENGVVVETPQQLFGRVARHISAVEAAYGYSAEEVEASRARFERMMSALEFVPNSPTLMNAGRPLGQLAACFVVPVDDSTTGVFEAVRWAAEIQKTGGGTGFSFSRLRPAGDLVASTGGNASGPVSLMQVFDVATEAIKQGGTRRGANMGMLRVDHPDILEFIALKLDPSRMRNFNLSVAATDAFMAAVAAGTTYDLINPRTGTVTGQLDARRVFDAIANAAWAVGDPGLVFIDRVNDLHPTPQLGAIEATNPCVTGDTRIWVNGRGQVPIRELVGQAPEVATFDTDERALVYRPVTQVVETGTRPIVKVMTREGIELRLTADHRVMTDHGDTPASELRINDQIQIALAPPVSVDVDAPKVKLAELVGWLTGSGTLRDEQATLAFRSEWPEVTERLQGTLRAYIGEDDSVLGPRYERRLFKMLADVGIDASLERRVPEWVWRGSPEILVGYLRGVFSAVARIEDDTIQIGLPAQPHDTLDTELMRGVQQLLLHCGIRSVIGGGTSETWPFLALTPSGLATFASTIGFVDRGKAEALRALVERHDIADPTTEPLGTRALAEARTRRRKLDIFDAGWATISALEPDGEEVVFDLTEPTTSHFFANGLLVHNCGEQPLLPFESCTLGSIDVGRFVAASGTDLDWPRLRETIHDSVRFLDDVIDANRYPLPEIERATKATRKIGLGIMGWADALVALDIPYDSDAAVSLGERLAGFLEDESLAASAELAERRGPFPAWQGSRWDVAGQRPLRNATTTTIAPTGTISIIAGCASGIEPLYALAYRRNVLDGAELTEVNPAFQRAAAAGGFASPELFAAVAEHGGVRGHAAVPAEVQRRFPTAHDVDVTWHVKMQAAFQRHVHAAVSKTINLRREATAADVKAAYQLAYELGCKGITVYRDGSREGQVLVTGARGPVVSAAPSCPECGSVLVVQTHCRLCRHCGWSVCG